MTKITLITSMLFIVCNITLAGVTEERTNEYLEDTTRFCKIFSPNSWKEMRSNFQGPKLQEEFLRRIDTAVVTTKVKAILRKQHTLKKEADYIYQYYVTEFSRLTGISYSCPDLKTYFEETFRD